MIPWRPFSIGLNGSGHYFARYYLLRMLPFPQLRRGVAGLIAGVVRLTGGKRRTPKDAAKAAKAVASQIESSGFHALSPVLNAEQIKDIRAFLETQPAYEGKRELLVTPGPCDAVRAAYPMETILKCPHILEAINNPEVLAIAEAFLGCRPTIAAIGLNWSIPADKVSDVQRFHRDSEAWRLLNMFIYLTDVDEESGPHRYVLGSHRTRGRLRLKPYSEAYVYDKYGKSQAHMIVGPAGTSFIENGWGIHEANPPISKRRLILAVMYSLGPIPIYDYDQVKVSGSHEHEPYVNRLLFN